MTDGNERIINKKVLKTSALLFLIIAMTRIFGLARGILLAGLWGLNESATAFEVAFTLQSSIFDLSAGAVISLMFIPAYNNAYSKGGLSDASELASRSSGLCVLSLAALLVPCAVFAGPLCGLIAGDAGDSTVKLAAGTARIMLMTPFFTGISAIFTGVLQSAKRPLVPSLAALAASVFVFVMLYVVGDDITPFTLAVITLASAVMCMLLILLGTRRIGITPRISFGMPGKISRNIPGVLCALAFSAYIPSSTLIAASAASGIGSGRGTAAVGFAWRIAFLVAGIFAFAASAVFYPALAKKAGRGGERAAAFRINALILAVSVPVAALLFVFAERIVTAVYMRGNFSRDDMLTTVAALRYYSLAVPALSIIGMQVRTAYVGAKRALPIIGSAAAVLTNLIFLKTLPSLGGTGRIALSFSLSVTMLALFYSFALRQRKRSGRIKLLTVLTDSNIGGAGRQLLNYLGSADTESFDITVSLPENSLLGEKVTALGFGVLPSPGDRSFSAGDIFHYIRIIRKVKPNIVHTNACLSARIAAFICGVPVRIYTRHCVFPVSRVEKRFLRRAAVSLGTRLLSHSIVAVAESAAANLRDMGVPSKLITVIPNGTPPLTECGDTDSLRDLVRDPGATVCGICGRLEADKGHKYLIKAAKLAKARGEKIAVMIIGQGSLDATLKKAVCDEGLDKEVIFLGFRENVVTFLKTIDILVNCSTGTEATSLAIAEAMSLSLPIIATDYGGNAEIVRDGVNGIIIPRRDPEALAAAITRLSDAALRKKMGENSKAIYLSEYSADRMARKTEKLYNDLADKAFRRPDLAESK